VFTVLAFFVGLPAVWLSVVQIHESRDKKAQQNPPIPAILNESQRERIKSQPPPQESGSTSNAQEGDVQPDKSPSGLGKPNTKPGPGLEPSTSGKMREEEKPEGPRVSSRREQYGHVEFEAPVGWNKSRGNDGSLVLTPANEAQPIFPTPGVVSASILIPPNAIAFEDDGVPFKAGIEQSMASDPEIVSYRVVPLAQKQAGVQVFKISSIRNVAGRHAQQMMIMYVCSRSTVMLSYLARSRELYERYLPDFLALTEGAVVFPDSSSRAAQ